MSTFHVAENQVRKSVRAKYIPDGNGGLRLVKIQAFNTKKFLMSGWEISDVDKIKLDKIADCVCVDFDDVADDGVSSHYRTLKGDIVDIERAIKRAQVNAFDYILCNHDLDLFVTFTYSPDSVSDKSSYDECYKRLSVWLSNRVQRRRLKYVIVPEHTKKGDIHFHAICNSSALRLIPAVSPYTGKKLTHNGKPLYNICDWSFGFTSAEFIGSSAGDREAVAKYIFKYMRKQMGQKIGGRYLLTGGDLIKPVYVLGDTADEFFTDIICKFDRHIELSCGLVYDEWSFI